MPDIFSSFLKTGITADLSSLEAKRIVLTNFTFALCIFLCVTLGPYYHLFGYTELTWLFFFFGVYFIGSLTISFLGFNTLAKPLLFFGVLTQTFFLCLFSGMVQEAKELYIPIMIIPFMIYGRNERWLLIVSLAAALLLVLLIYNSHSFPIYFKNYSDNSYLGVSYTLNIICISCMLMLSFLFTQLTESSESQLQKLNKKLAYSEDELQRMNQLKDQLIRIIAHDVRSPISSTQGVAALLKNNQLEKDDIQFLAEKIFNSAQHTQAMLDDLMTWSNSQLNVSEPVLVSVELKPFVQKIMDGVQYKAVDKHIKFSVLMNDLQIMTDSHMLEIILRNLLSNAIKYSFNNGQIEIHAFEDKKMVYLEVTDYGVGIPPDKLEFIFEPRPNKSTLGTAHEKGAGVGLLICKNLMELLRIDYKVQSELKKRTTFTLVIPKAS
ncbi:MAG: HAMP domain-containing sensor histidine kinase [Cytophagaceae bacterium]